MVGITFLVFTVVGGMFLSRVMAAIFGGLRWNDPPLLGVEELALTSVIGFAVAIGVALALYLNQRVQAGSLEIAAELKKVTWPSLGETRVSTIAVIIASVVSALILFFFDFIASKVMTVWVPSLLGWLARL